MNKILKKTGKIFSIIVVIIAVCMMIFTIGSTIFFNKTDKALFGFQSFIVRSDSMSATDFSAGDLVIVKKVDPHTLAAGDIIAFTSQDDDSYGETITHKIREISVNENGETCFITYGTTTNTDDRTPVTYPYVIGKYVRAVPKLGSFFNFLKTVPGYFVCVFAPFMILIIMQATDTIKTFRKYKEEQAEEILSERKALEKERDQTQQMLKELEELKNQLAAQRLAAAQDAEVNAEATAQHTAEENGNESPKGTF